MQYEEIKFMEEMSYGYKFKKEQNILFSIDNIKETPMNGLR